MESQWQDYAMSSPDSIIILSDEWIWYHEKVSVSSEQKQLAAHSENRKI